MGNSFTGRFIRISLTGNSVIEPLFWLGLSILLVAVSLTAVLVVALPAMRELARAARSAEKLFDTLSRELPPTLEAIRLTGLEISDLTDDLNDGVQSARNVAKQVDQSIGGTKQQIEEVSVTTRSVFTGVKAAWKTLNRPQRDRHRRDRDTDRSLGYLSPSQRTPVVSQTGSDQSVQEPSNVSGSLNQDIASTPSNLPAGSETTSEESSL